MDSFLTRSVLSWANEPVAIFSVLNSTFFAK
ncbi:unnamed protein product [Linum tenue]|uniref:Uncharacterized protein n=1 Tax=Linum tenue TaxID=586396 RepID=A0AAV0N344_9ROSI|nr:unnamed protein product [Linum tenue]